MQPIEHSGLLWRWTSASASASWFFVTIDGAAGDVLSATALMRRLELGQRRGFGMVRVSAQIGGSRWQTSVFPQKGQGWMLPVKASVRRAEALCEGDQVALILEVA